MSEIRKAVEGHVTSIDSDAAFGLICVTCGKVLAELPDLSSPNGAIMILQAGHADFFSDPHEMVVVNMGDSTCLGYPKIPEDIVNH